MDLDDKDRQLLALLRKDARLPVSSLAQHLKVSRATVQNRIDRLKERGVIQGFSVRLRTDADIAAIRAITMLQVGALKTNVVLKALRKLTEISTLHTTNGRWDIIAEIRTENLQQFDIALTRIRDIDGVENTETSILLTSHKL